VLQLIGYQTKALPAFFPARTSSLFDVSIRPRQRHSEMPAMAVKWQSTNGPRGKEPDPGTVCDAGGIYQCSHRSSHAGSRRAGALLVKKVFLLARC